MQFCEWPGRNQERQRVLNLGSLAKPINEGNYFFLVFVSVLVVGVTLEAIKV